MNLSEDFLSYLRSGQSKFGDRDEFPMGFKLWEEADLGVFNDQYEVPRYAPGFFGFGSDGGGEMLAFDSAGKVYAIPFIGMSAEDATFVADSWRDFQASFK